MIEYSNNFYFIVRISRYISSGSLESKSIEYTVFRNLKRRGLLKDLEEEYIHEKTRKYDNEAIKNDFVTSCLVTTTAIINSKTPRKRTETETEQLESCSGAKFITTGLMIILKRNYLFQLHLPNILPHFHFQNMTSLHFHRGFHYAHSQMGCLLHLKIN